MNDHRTSRRRRAAEPSALYQHACPACLVRSDKNPQWCPSCQFTGGDTMTLFPGPPPPLLPILDAASILDPKQANTVTKAITKLQSRFPQFRFRICSAHLPPDTRIRLFGFWLMNACPLADGESPHDRAWTILLVINTANHRATVIPGYYAERWLSDDQCQKAMETMKPHWQAENHTKAILAFLNSTKSLLESSWRRAGAPKPA